jgi:predicted nucleic-acid-binding protein
MNAVDTNVLARFFVNDTDDAESVKQQPAAINIMSGKVFVSASVVLEFEWVLRGFYEFPRKEIQRIFESLCGLENVQIENREAVLAALNGYQLGLDFADALHLSSARSCVAFVTFDQKLRKRALALAYAPLVETPS